MKICARNKKPFTHKIMKSKEKMLDKISLKT